MVSLIVAIAKNGVIGRGLEMPWKLSEDLKLFKSLTAGHAVIMGRLTWQSLGKPLKDRLNIVVSRTLAQVQGIVVATNLHEALQAARDAGKEVFIIGGRRLYEEGLGIADRLCLSRVDLEPEGDVLFPKVDWTLFKLEYKKAYEGFEYQEWIRK
jgi:dihydrofolate reductase